MRLALLHHPDKQGDPAAFRKVQEAWEEMTKNTQEARSRIAQRDRSGGRGMGLRRGFRDL